MKKLWKDIKVGDVMKDGSIVTQVHRTHEQEACKIIYDYNKEFILWLHIISSINSGNIFLGSFLILRVDMGRWEYITRFKSVWKRAISRSKNLVL